MRKLICRNSLQTASGVEGPMSAVDSPTSLWPAVPATSGLQFAHTDILLHARCETCTSLAPAGLLEAVAAGIRVTCIRAAGQSIFARRTLTIAKHRNIFQIHYELSFGGNGSEDKRAPLCLCQKTSSAICTIVLVFGYLCITLRAAHTPQGLPLQLCPQHLSGFAMVVGRQEIWSEI